MDEKVDRGEREGGERGSVNMSVHLSVIPFPHMIFQYLFIFLVFFGLHLHIYLFLSVSLISFSLICFVFTRAKTKQ